MSGRHREQVNSGKRKTYSPAHELTFCSRFAAGQQRFLNAIDQLTGTERLRQSLCDTQRLL
jgi:hypothetical protein